MEQKKQPSNLFFDFLKEFETIPEHFVKGLINSTSDEDEIRVINSFAPALKNQFKELSSYLISKSERISRKNFNEVNLFLKTSSGLALVAEAKALSKDLTSSVSRIGVNDIITEIKKIIYFIFDIFGIVMPEWLRKLFLLIDEIVKDLITLLFPRLTNYLSKKEQNFLNELTALERLNRQVAPVNMDEEDDE